MAETPLLKDLPILPKKAVEVILSKLPTKSLSRFTIVSKSWKAIICSPQFNIRRCMSQPQDLYFVWGFEQHPTSFCVVRFDFDERNFTVDGPHTMEPSRPLCSCNGILLMKTLVGDECYLSLCNPTIGLNVSILRQHISEDMSINYGHYYDSRIDDYRVVVISRQRRGNLTYRVYSCRNREWGDEKPFPYTPTGFGVEMERAEFVDGCFFWWGHMKHESISYFDVRVESLNLILMPDELVEVTIDWLDKIKLSQVGGRLCVYCKSRDWSCIRVWVMKKHVHVHDHDLDSDVWGHLVEMEENVFISWRPPRSRKQDLVVCLTDGSERLQRARFVVYDEYEGQYTMRRFSSEKQNSLHYFLPFARSLFSPTNHW